MARLTGLEPATPGVTGRYSNQLSYNRSLPPGDPSVRRVLFRACRPVKRTLPLFLRNFCRKAEVFLRATFLASNEKDTRL